ncbi:hypothetical protein ACHAWT_001296 [Skeletonema menzelii]
MNSKQKILKAFRAITDSSDHYKGRWICDQCKLMTSHSPTTVKDIKDLRTAVVRTLKTLVGNFDSSNANNVYYKKFYMPCPIDSKDRTVHFFYRGHENEIPFEPKCASEIKCAFATSQRMLQNRTRGVPNVDDGSNSEKDNKSKKKTKNKSTDTEQQSKRSKEVVPNVTVTAAQNLGPYHDRNDPWMVKVGQTLGLVYPKDGEDVDSDVFVPPSPFNLSITAREEKKNDVEIEIPIEK